MIRVEKLKNNFLYEKCYEKPVVCMLLVNLSFNIGTLLLCNTKQKRIFSFESSKEAMKIRLENDSSYAFNVEQLAKRKRWIYTRLQRIA